jgi:NADPH:quinone reductase-like Zn-dependent oxidoreductase
MKVGGPCRAPLATGVRVCSSRSRLAPDQLPASTRGQLKLVFQLHTDQWRRDRDRAGAVTGFTSATMLIRVSLRGAGPGGRWSWGRPKDIAMVSAHVTTKDLEPPSELIAAGKVRPQIDRSYPFAEIPAAIAYLEQGRATAKVVVGVA